MKLNSKKLTIGLLIACLLLATVSTAAATEWPMFQNNPRHKIGRASCRERV